MQVRSRSRAIRYRLVSRALNGRFLRVRNRSEYPVQEKNPKGEIHEDEGFFSFDRTRKRLVLRQFHVEGFVQSVRPGRRSSREPARVHDRVHRKHPPGSRARETYIVHGADEFEKIFELAPPDEPFTLYSRARLSRMK